MQNLKNIAIGAVIAILATMVAGFYGAIHDLQQENDKLREGYAVCQNTLLQSSILGKEQEKSIKAAHAKANKARISADEDIKKALNVKVPNQCDNAVRWGISEGQKL